MHLKGGSWYILSVFSVILEAHAIYIRPNIKGNGITEVSVVPTANGVEIELLRDSVVQLRGTIGVGLNFSERIPYNYSLTLYDEGDAYRIEWETNDTSNIIKDCYDLERGTVNWYGGPQIYQQEWPIEKLNLSGNDPYVARKDGNFAVPERYWLSSRGAYIFVSERVPLYVDQNMEENGKVCFIAKNSGPYINRKSVVHSYVIAALDDAVAAHRHALQYLGRPSAIPNKKLIKEPIWTTWAKYKKEITDTMVREFAYDIVNHGFEGQIEIDEKWETCFGSRIFMPDKFGNITNVVKDLKSKNLRVTLWAAPFVNPDCEDLVKEGEEKGYFVKNINGDMNTVWWESTNAKARQIDFTKAEVREWYSEKLRKLLVDPGVDSFKFDAGETDYVAQPAVYENEDPELVPNIFTQRYINTVAQFGDLIEARSAFRTQNYSFFLRMIDKDSLWGLDDGLQSLVTTLLQLNMVGYSFVLPDMIGGNGYRAQPDLELLIRWTQATVFMPSMQFSYLPWDFANDYELNGTEIIRSMIYLHGNYSGVIEEAMTATIHHGTPTNPPIWWIDPTDKIALQTSDEYLLGENILVAPVMEKGATSRTVYLPRGTWKDGNNNTNIYTGPLSFTYNAPISILPYFIRSRSWPLHRMEMSLDEMLQDGASSNGLDFTNLCGEEGLQIWSASRHDIGNCFQQLVLDIPVLGLLAIFSSYYLGRSDGLVARGRPQLVAIRLRCFLTLLLAFLPLVQIYIFIFETSENIPQIAYFLSAVQGLAWFVHFLYNMSLRTKLGKSPRGPMVICVLWSLIFVLTVISVRTHSLLLKYSVKPLYSYNLAYGMSLCYFIIQIFYALTLIPGEGETTYLNFVERYTEITENQPLLSNAYGGFLEEGDPAYLGVALENANWLSKLLFAWVEPLMKKGVQGQLKNSDDLYDLPVSLNCSAVSRDLEKALCEQKRGGGNEETEQRSQELQSIVEEVQVQKTDTTLVKALHKVFWFEFYIIGILKLIADLAGFGGPMLLNRLIAFIEDKSEDIMWGYLYAGGLLGTTLISSLCDSHFQFLISKVGFRMRGAIVTMIYKKTLSVSNAALTSQFSVGEIVNFMSTDTDRIVNSCPSFHALWSIPFQLGVTLYLLFSQVGISFLAGLIFSIILIPVNKLIANKIGDLSTKLMEQKDSRVKLITEVLRGIKAVKLYVWEDHFMRQISRLRLQELKHLKGRKYLDALCVYFWATTPVIISILTFATYVLLGHKLTAATVFTSIALLNMLISPLNAFPWVLNGLMEAWVSIKRIQKLLQLPDLDLNSYYQPLEENAYDIILKNAGFNHGKELTPEEKQALHGRSPKKSYKGKGLVKSRSAVKKVSFNGEARSDGEKFYLKGINLKVRKGEFIGIMGPVGCGKSSILSAVLAELSVHSGEVSISQIESGFGYVSQQPWLQHGTLRDNILFGKSFDEQKYKDVLFACGLIDDINILPNGDMTGVGESGMTLSGGQKARVALARAVYQDKSVYLFDDILSAVDPKVAKHIFQHCIMGLLKDKTKILCTHHVQFLAYASRIVVMDKGTIKKQGKPSEILPDIDDSLALDIELGESLQSTLTNSFFESSRETSSVDKENDIDSVLNLEVSERGSLSFSVYASYWNAIGHLLCLSILMSLILMQTSRNMTDWWLAHWVTNAESINGTNITNVTLSQLDSVPVMMTMLSTVTAEDNSSSYLKIYIEFAVVNTLFTLFRAFLFAYGGIVAAAKFHKLLLKAVVKAKSTFFDITPLGRILNRFSSDTYTVDDSLPFILNILLAQFFGLLGSIGITVYGLPWICMLLVPLIPVYHWLQNYYRLTSRELKRITSVTLSPVYSHFNETLQGLTTINAMRANQRFKRENQDHVDSNIKAQFASQAAIRWLGLRLQFIGVGIITGVSFIAVVQHQYDVADPGLIGLAISYALTVTGLLSGVVNAFTETEREMIAVERVNQYIKEIPLESTNYVTDPPFGWPNQGVISFNNVVLRYREHLIPSLKGITFETRSSEKIGVVGRTGAGKSSIISALFRMVEISSGEISIDSVNISRVSISALRSRLFCIPQDPFLFSGTLRENLDPLGEFRESEIWNALSKVNLENTIKNLGGLTNKVAGGGSNFSVGQKQLICLARAVLHNAKVLCIDEATANVDQDTDRQIQQTLRSAFRKSTVLTIAHRVQTILDSDRVLVMHEGQIIEFDTPDNLLNDTNSLFYQLVNQDV